MKTQKNLTMELVEAFHDQTCVGYDSGCDWKNHGGGDTFLEYARAARVVISKWVDDWVENPDPIFVQLRARIHQTEDQEKMIEIRQRAFKDVAKQIGPRGGM